MHFHWSCLSLTATVQVAQICIDLQTFFISWFFKSIASCTGLLPFLFLFPGFFSVVLAVRCRKSIDFGESGDCYKKNDWALQAAFINLLSLWAHAMHRLVSFTFCSQQNSKVRYTPLKESLNWKSTTEYYFFVHFAVTDWLLEEIKWWPHFHFLDISHWCLGTGTTNFKVFFFLLGLLRRSKGIENLPSFASGFSRMPCSPKFTD